MTFVKDPNKVRTRARKPAAASAEPVSELTTNRLSVYLRCLNALDAAGVRTVSSQGLAEQFHLNAAQIRKDLAYFGEFGVRGVGYYVKELRRHLRQILGLDGRVAIAIMGAGNLGLALADYPGFREEGFEIAALFDTDAREDRAPLACRRSDPRHPRVPPPRPARADPHRRDCRAGRSGAGGRQHGRGGWRQGGAELFPGYLKVPPDVKLKSVDLTVSLESLSFFLAQGELDG